jgi:hypothetical protein
VNLGRNALRVAAAVGVAGALTAGLVGAVGAVGTASAAPAASEQPASPSANCNWQGRGDGTTWQTSFAGNGINIRSGPGTGCTVVGSGFGNQGVTLYCGNGSDSDLWWYIHDNSTGVNGWVSAGLLNFDPEDVPPIFG